MIDEAETFDGTWPFFPRFTTAPGFRMHYVDEGAGDPVIMLHGQPTWGYLYRNFITPLSQQHRVIVPDHMGFGKSETPQDREYTLQAHVENLEALIDSLSLSNITFVMQDWGARIGGCFALRHPHRVKRLCIINGVVPTRSMLQRAPMKASGASGLTPWFRWIHEGVDDGRVQQVLGNLGSTVLSVMKIIGFQNSAAVTDTWIRAYSDHFKSPQDCIGAIAFPLDAYNGSAWPFASRCAAEGQDQIAELPAMLIRGMRDYAITRENMVGSFMEIWPKGPVIELERAGHFAQEDAPETIVPLIKQFIQLTP